ncbi:hypothetical protein AGOR_G00219370 [Albula goreensis]|uniref:CREG-like beta-barrel domain-containing protein n=1 Tax=Albula goreensis TaxID=1534307 RepID=A0A8T3CJX7_9TELE|nr:hypothetical protein AGOR_G00219370 [Albula goreensis]
MKTVTMSRDWRTVFIKFHFLLAILAVVLCISDGHTTIKAVLQNVEGELDNNSNEAIYVFPGDTASTWKRADSAALANGNAVKQREHRLEKGEVKQVSSLYRLFSDQERETKASAGTQSPPPPPPHEETARTARYMAHFSDWGHLATISSMDKIKGLPFGNIFSVSDGPPGNSTGIPYFYVTPMDNTVVDLRSFPMASLTFSEAEGDYCRKNQFDPEDPRCARLTLTGKMVEVPPEELDFAMAAMFSRHPVMKKWPPGHHWFFMKLDLVQVWLQNWFGGVSLIPLDVYFKTTPY